MEWIVKTLVMFAGTYLMSGFLIWKIFDCFKFALLPPKYGFFSLNWGIVRGPSPLLVITQIPWQFEIRLAVPFLLAITVAVFFSGILRRHEKFLAEGKVVHVKGRQYIHDPKEAAKLLAKENRQGDGLQINPTLPSLNYLREAEHFIFLGGVGCGKTATLWPWLNAARSRGDQILVHDVKGDFTASLPQPVVLLAPWDKRGFYWDIANDVDSRAAAREFAEGIIPDSQSSPVFPSAARQVLVGCLVCLQATKPGKWGFKDLAGLIYQPRPELLKVMQQYNPEAIRAVEQDNVTTAGILINIMSALTPIFDLAAAWPDPAQAKGKVFSVKRWLLQQIKNQDGEIPVVILQNNGQFETLANGLHGAMVRIAAQFVCSPEMPEDSSRRIWFMLDEFPRLGKIKKVGTLLDLGRSKGVRMVIVAQSLEQIKESYGDNLGKSWVGLAGNLIIGRSQGETAKYLSETAIGKREVERHTVSVSRSLNQGSGAGATRTFSVASEERDVVKPNELSEHLGVDKKAGGVHILFITGKYALRLLIPFSNQEKVRSPFQLAGWTVTAPEARLPAAPAAGGAVQAEAQVMAAQPVAATEEDAAAVLPAEVSMQQAPQESPGPALDPEDLDAIQRALGLSGE